MILPLPAPEARPSVSCSETLPQGGFIPPEDVLSTGLPRSRRRRGNGAECPRMFYQQGSHGAEGAVGMGQNARLAARLTGYKIDIKPASYKEEE